MSSFITRNVVKVLLNDSLCENSENFDENNVCKACYLADGFVSGGATPSVLSELDWYRHIQKHLVANTPCVFPSEFTSSWRCRKEWVTEDGCPRWNLLTATFGNALVPVANCRVKYYNSQLKEDMKFVDYVSYWQSVILNNYNYDKCDTLYLKDWHFVRDFPDYCPYETPLCFKSDWLNEFWTKTPGAHDDYRFVYMGPKGSWTSLHADVFSSYSWSANICGAKKWILFPPEEEENLKDAHGKLAYDVNAPEMSDKGMYPNFLKVRCRVEIVQKAGEVIFVPSGWIHQVHNLEDTISVNHNWFNGFNIDVIWRSMKEALAQVQHEIRDCKDMDGWDDQCQLILKATHGMDIKDFCSLLRIVGRSRLEEANKRVTENAPVESLLRCRVEKGEEHKAIEDAAVIFDLGKVRWAFECVRKEFPDAVELDVDMLEEIDTILTRDREVVCKAKDDFRNGTECT